MLFISLHCQDTGSSYNEIATHLAPINDFFHDNSSKLFLSAYLRGNASKQYNINVITSVVFHGLLTD